MSEEYLSYATWFAMKIGALEQRPELLDHIFRPMWWATLCAILMWLISAVSRSRVFRRIVGHVVWLWAGICVLLLTVYCTRVFCVVVDSDSLTAQDFELTRARMLFWMLEIVFLWAGGSVIVGVVSLVRSLSRKHSGT